MPLALKMELRGVLQILRLERVRLRLENNTSNDCNILVC